MPTVRIDSIAAGGDGVARHDGLVVFIPRTAPGDLVEVDLHVKGRLARGRVTRVVEGSPDRVDPPCRHYAVDRCGGCQLQHLDLTTQRGVKQRMIVDAFARIARRAVEPPPIVASPAAWEYRTRLTLALRWSGGRWIMGLHRFDDVDGVFDLVECPITDSRVVAAWKAVRMAGHLLPRAPRLRATVRLLGDELGMTLEGGDAWPASREFAGATPFAVIRWRPDRGSARVVVDRRPAATPDTSFDQVNPVVAAIARRELVQRALAASPRSAVDAYAGLGAVATALASSGVTVTAIEADEAAARHLGRHLPPPSRVLAARVEEVIRSCLPADVVLLNPPRAGVDARVTAALEAGPRPALMLYMSCDPATLARDVSRLPAYRVRSLRGYDMFPQTAHVEVVCELVPEGA